jgi:UDP-N-acetylmuramoyl-tripeptide--D-alanyl-D-alanine ligase
LQKFLKNLEMSIAEIYILFKASTGVTTDTRNIKPGQLFFALKGEKFNANSFAKQGVENGAAFAIIDEKEFAVSDKCILVADVLKCLQDLAAYHRSQLGTRIIALTGSNGKTTNKELLMRVLATKIKVHATVGNLNNHIGVPLTLLAMPAETEIGIIEMGANHQQEIKELCLIAQPDFGFITNIGKAHLEGFGGVEGVKKGKGELFDYLVANQKTAFINEQDQTLVDMAKARKMVLNVFYGRDEKALKPKAYTPEIIFETPESKIFTAFLSGSYNFDNMQTAYAVGLYFGVPSELAAEAIAGYNPDNNRSQRVELGSNSFIMDAYNANPSSMQASVQNFAELKTEKPKVIILGDMFELGEYAEAEHQALGKQIAGLAFDKIILYGQNMVHALPFNPSALYFTDKFSLHNYLKDSNLENHIFLVKGSRSVGLESILDVFK